MLSQPSLNKHEEITCYNCSRTTPFDNYCTYCGKKVKPKHKTITVYKPPIESVPVETTFKTLSRTNGLMERITQKQMFNDEKYKSASGLSSSEDSSAWVFATFPDYVIVEKGNEYFKVPYSDDGQNVNLGNSTKVERIETFKAIKEALGIGKVAESVDVSFTTELLEAKAIEGKQGIYELTLLREGETEDKKRTYKRAALESAVTLFEGAQAYADHPTKSELKERPERSIRDIVGIYENARVEADNGISKLKADLKTLESAQWVRPLLDLAVEQPNMCGASIHADGTITPGKPDIVESIDSVFSVDIVTKPNAGGKVERLIASIRDEEEGGDDVKIEELNIETLKKDRPDLVEALQKEVKPKEEEKGGKIDMTKFVVKEDYDKLNDKYEATVIKSKIKASGLTDKIADDKDKELVTSELAESMKGKKKEDMDKVIEARKALVKSIKGQIVNPAKGTDKGMYKIGSILSEAGQAAQNLVR